MERLELDTEVYQITEADIIELKKMMKRFQSPFWRNDRAVYSADIDIGGINTALRSAVIKLDWGNRLVAEYALDYDSLDHFLERNGGTMRFFIVSSLLSEIMNIEPTDVLIVILAFRSFHIYVGSSYRGPRLRTQFWA